MSKIKSITILTCASILLILQSISLVAASFTQTHDTSMASQRVDKKENVVFSTFSQVYDHELAQGAILNASFPGFKEDYLLVHCLIKNTSLRRFLK